MHFTSGPGLVCAFILTLVSVAEAQVAQCYNPNGSEASDSVPCGSGNNQVCCPLQWQCLDNGLCYNPTADILGRYSCTDQNWDNCGNNFCTYNKSNIGNEAILACGGDNYCCNLDRQQGDCCQTPASFTQITLPSGRVYATVTASDEVAAQTTGAGPSIPPSESANQSSSPPQSSQPPATSTNAPDPTSVTEEAVTSEFTSVITTDGTSPITVVSTRVITPTAVPGGSNNNANPNPNDSSGSNTGLIVGCAVGIPVGLIALGLLAFFLWRRRRQAKRNAPDFDEHAGTKVGGVGGGLEKPSYESGTIDAKYTPNPLPTGSQGNPVEADGTSQMTAAAAASTRPVSELADTSRVLHMAELEGSTTLVEPKASEGVSAPVTPVVGLNNASDSPVSSTGSFDDLRSKGAHAAHFGAVPLPAVKEGEVLQGAETTEEKQGESTPGGRFIPSKPTQ